MSREYSRKHVDQETRRWIIHDSAAGETRACVAKRYGVSISTVCKIVSGRPDCDWFHVGGFTSGRKNYNRGY